MFINSTNKFVITKLEINFHLVNFDTSFEQAEIAFWSPTATACDGFAQIDAASGDYVTVAFLTNFGTQKGIIGTGPVTVGDTLYLGSSGVLATSGTVTIGKALTTTASNGATIEFLPKNI